jgi:hypothetical protein
MVKAAGTQRASDLNTKGFGGCASRPGLARPQAEANLLGMAPTCASGPRDHLRSALLSLLASTASTAVHARLPYPVSRTVLCIPSAQAFDSQLTMTRGRRCAEPRAQVRRLSHRCKGSYRHSEGRTRTTPDDDAIVHRAVSIRRVKRMSPSTRFARSGHFSLHVARLERAFGSP